MTQLRTAVHVFVAVLLACSVSAYGQQQAPPPETGGSAAGSAQAAGGSGSAAPATTAPAAEPAAAPAAKPERKPYDIRTSKTLTGDWGGARTRLEEAGLSFSLTSQTQYMVNMQGGLETTNGNDFGGSYDLSLEFDFQKMKLIKGGSFFIRASGTYGGEVSDFDKEKIGGLFKTNNDADIEEPIYVSKWWYRQRLLDDRIEVRLGRLVTAKDLFDVSKYANSEDLNFMNSALVVNPTIPHKNGLGAYLNVWPVDWLYARAAVVDPESKTRQTGFDTAFHGEDRAAAYWEIGYAPKFKTAKGPLAGNYRVGSWYWPQPKTVFRNTYEGTLATQTRSGDVGFYAGLDQLVWKENDKPKDEQGLGVFAKYGAAHGDVNRIDQFWAVGVQYQGLIPTRDKDVLAFGVAQGVESDEYRKEVRPRADRETVYEAYYSIQFAPWCVFTPDVQYVTQPGGDKEGRDAFVAGFRLRVSF